ncbi:hypothetical protein HK405_015743, partial [Cladochytrium tenue]
SLMAAQGAYLATYLACDSSWLCVRTLNPVPSQYTYPNGTNPRDQVEMMSFVNGMVRINGAPEPGSTPTESAATTSSGAMLGRVPASVSSVAAAM